MHPETDHLNYIIYRNVDSLQPKPNNHTFSFVIMIFFVAMINCNKAFEDLKDFGGKLPDPTHSVCMHECLGDRIFIASDSDLHISTPVADIWQRWLMC